MRLLLNGWFYDKPFNGSGRSLQIFLKLLPPVFIAGIAWVLFLPAFHYGFIWDDPIWLRVSVQGSPLELITRAQTWEDYRYYRPIGIGLFRLFARPDGTFDARGMHVLQVAIHAAVSVLVYGLARQLRLKPLTAWLAAGLFVIYPHNHQAVVRVLQSEPLCALFILTAANLYLAARTSIDRKRWFFYIVSLVSYTLALFTIESAVPFAALFLFLELWLGRRGQRQPFRYAWMLYGILALMFVILWRTLPPQTVSGTKHIGFYPENALLLLQAATYPLGLALAIFKIQLPETVMVGLFVLVILLVVALLWKKYSPELLVGAIWFTVGVSLVMLLNFEYVRIGSRLMYLGSIGVTLVWALVIESLAAPNWRLGLASLFAGGVSMASLQANLVLTEMYNVGNAHLFTLTQSLAMDDSPQIYINYPDRFALKDPPLPLGYWGITVAQGALNLADYASVGVGDRSPTLSLAVPAANQVERAAWPYEVDMRGDVLEPTAFYESLRGAGRIFRTDYLPDGNLKLVSLGGIQSIAATPNFLATFAQALVLESAQVEKLSGQLNLTIFWRVSATLNPNDTIFVHLLDSNGQVVVSADGDSLGGLVPLHLLILGDTLRDERVVLVPSDLPLGTYILTVGLYNRASSERLIATNAQGGAVWDNEVAVATVDWP